MNTEETPPTKKVATIADAIACYHRTAGNTPPDSGQAVSVHCRGFSEMPQETQDAIIKMCHAAKKDMESGAFDPQNEPRTCPYCDQPRQDTFENRWRFECGTALQRIDGKTVKQGSECKLRVAYSKLLVDWCKQKERISELKQAHAELLATKLPEYDRCETCNFELGPFGPLGTDGEPTTDCLVCQLREQTNKLRAALEWYAEQTRLCRLIHSEGDPGRNALSADGGQRARAALNQTTK